MAIRMKRKATAGYTWQTGDLVEGQIGLNTADGTLHFKQITGSGSSRTALTVSVSGDARVTTGYSKFGGASAAFDGTGDRLTITDASLDLGTNNFTIEMWIYLNDRSSDRAVFSTGPASFGSGCISFSSTGTTYGMGFLVDGNPNRLINDPDLTTLNTWQHYAIVRSGNTFTLYRDGVNVSSNTYSGSINLNNSSLYIGDLAWALGNSSYGMNGYIDEFRISNTARYSGTFTPLNAAFTNDANTLLLLHMNGANNSTSFTDDAGNGVVESIVKLEPSVQGIQGIQGVQGTTGTTGSAGSQGIQGVQGADGAVGSQGIQGVQGADGSTGSVGSQGIQGVQGADGATGSPGTTGSAGSQGTQGIQGVQGSDATVQGIQGVQGSTGTQGTSGVVGSNGSQGIQGVQGADGTNGSSGAQGIQGVQGSDATVQGIQGVQGATGTNGTIGVDGAQGIQGVQGLTGTLLETVYSLGTTSGTITPDFANGSTQTITLNGNLTWNAFTSPVAGQTITLIINTNGTNRTLSSTMKFAGGMKTLSTTNTTDIISVFYDGTAYYASLAKGYV